MMKLALMRRFFDTVDAEWRSPLAEQIAARWVGKDAQVRVWRASANFVCRVEQDSQVYFLRFNHASERRAGEIQAELDFVKTLRARGVCAARPLVSRAGRLVETVTGALGDFHAALFEALPGGEREFDELDLADFETWGRALGQIHCAGEGFPAAARPGWRERLAQARVDIPPEEQAARGALEVAAAELDRLPAGPADFGMIHYDFEQDNLCWRDGALMGSLDYDDCGPHWYAADIAHALRDLFGDCPAGVDLAEPRLRAFVRGYRSERAMDEIWLERLPLFLRFHNLVAFARLTRALAGGAEAGEPEWLGELRGKLEGMAEGYRQSFVEGK